MTKIIFKTYRILLKNDKYYVQWRDKEKKCPDWHFATDKELVNLEWIDIPKPFDSIADAQNFINVDKTRDKWSIVVDNIN